MVEHFHEHEILRQSHNIERNRKEQKEVNIAFALSWNRQEWNEGICESSINGFKLIH